MSNLNRFSELELSGRDIPSFIEPRPPEVLHPFMRPRPQKRTNLLELFEEDSECEEPDLVQVYLRLKPCNTTITNLYEVRSERCLITSLDTTTAGHGRRTQHNVSKMYTFSHIFRSDSSQKEIFEHVVKDNLKKLTEGHSFTLLTYGASGSGKTFTLMGTVAAPGLVPRSLEYVFKIIEAAQRPCFKPSETGADVLSKAEQDYELKWVKSLRQVSAPLRDKYRRMSASLHSTITNSDIDLSNRTKNYVWVSFIEIYNEGIYDLLVPCDRRAASKLAIREDSSGNVYVKGATQAFVRSGEEAYDVMVAGKHNLQVAATGVHAQSSRSHCIFTITMLTEIDGEVRTACVRLCDLAGCERAARTRNTGARMQESRAINSSLHVLERCLHTLRRRQAGRRALVPYRESKLTRLLGAGLSGARGEAVSMVVTLNPAPEYAHETRHVLQLAAVAKDIQVNNTIAEYPSSLETSQDTTLGPSAEVMRLRAENERLRFELARSEAFNKEQLARMEEKEAAAVAHCDTWALVAEAKQISKQYYEERLQTMRKLHEEKAEEQENKIAELLVNITVLEEMLSAEKLSRARAEEEVIHLRSCIEERDEKSDENAHTEDVIDVLDSETSDNEDPFNESLEPTFKKEEINRSKITRQSLQHEAKVSDVERSFNVSNESVLEKSTEIMKDQESDDDSNNDCAVDNPYATSTEANDGNSNIVYQCENISEKKQSDIKETTQDDIFAEKYETTKSKNNNSILGSTSSINQPTYSVMKDNSLYESSVEVNNESEKFIKNNLSHVKETIVKEEILKNNDTFQVPDKPFVYSIINSLKKTIESNNSLAQFESLEKATKDYDISNQEVNIEIDKIKILKEKRHFFDSELKSDNVCSIKSFVNMAVDNTNISKENRNFFDSEVKSNGACSKKSGVNMPVDNMNIAKDKICFFDSKVNSNDSTKSDANMAVDNVNISKEKKKYFVEVKSKDACSTKSDVNMAVDNIDMSKEKRNFFDSEVKSKDACCNNSDVNMTIVNKYISKEKKNFFDSEVKSKDVSCIKSNINMTVDNKNISKEKINFDCETKSYDSSSTSDSKGNMENKTSFFEDTHRNIKDDYRSPSIVKDDLCTIDFEPQRINKLLCENNITPIEPISLIKKSYFSKEHKSMDVFDSPQVQYTLDELPSIDDIRRSMSNVNISNNKNDIPHENKNLTLQTTNKESLQKSSILLENDQLPSIDDIRRSIVKENISRKNKESKNQSDTQEKNNFNLKVSNQESLDKYSKSQLPSIDDIRESIAKENMLNKNDVHRIKKNALENNSLKLKISNQEGSESLMLKEKNHASNSIGEDNVNNTEKNINNTETDNVVKINESKIDLEVTNIKVDNTLEEFENIYKEITIPRSTEFDLLFTSNQNDAQISEASNIEQVNVDIENARYNLRKNKSKTERKPRKTKTKCLEFILMESVSKCESSSKFTKRNLRLRRRKNASDDDFVEPEKEEKLKDIANLQSEYSDITMDVPARPKLVNVIPSPEKEEEENVCPTLSIQSCPSKMSTRRRKLFTPRAEPLDESVASGDCDERVRVPRPSYHRPRARRKL